MGFLKRFFRGRAGVQQLPTGTITVDRNGHVITDYLAAQTAGRYLKQAIESGYDNGREMYTMTVEEVLAHADAVVKQAGGTMNLPSLPVINENIEPEKELQIGLPGEPLIPGIAPRNLNIP